MQRSAAIYPPRVDRTFYETVNLMAAIASARWRQSEQPTPVECQRSPTPCPSAFKAAELTSPRFYTLNPSKALTNRLKIQSFSETITFRDHRANDPDLEEAVDLRSVSLPGHTRKDQMVPRMTMIELPRVRQMAAAWQRLDDDAAADANAKRSYNQDSRILCLHTAAHT